MDYEFHMFERIIDGDLSPFSESDNSEIYLKSLQEKNLQCRNVITATFKKKKNNFVLDNKSVFNSLHPLASKNWNLQLDIFQQMSINDLSNEVLKSLDLKAEKVRNVIYTQQPSSTILKIQAVVGWDELSPNELKYYYYNDLLSQELQRIKDRIKGSVLAFKSSEKTEHYIHKLQQALVNLCFRLIRKLNGKEQNAIYAPAIYFTTTDILNLVFITLEKLLRFFEKNYLSSIDQNVLIPYRSALIKQYQIEHKLEVVKSRLLASEIAPALLKIIYIPFLKLSAITLQERMTYKELIYLNTYLQAFYDEIDEGEKTISEAQVIEVLYRVNYNSFELHFYKTSQISNEVALIDPIPDKIDFLYHRLKIVNQRQCRVNIAFDASIPSLKDQLMGWLEEEINYLNKKLKLQPHQHVNSLFSEEEKTKIETGLTVAQLAFFFKVQVDVGILTHKSQQDIFKHISESYNTTNASDISQASIKNKYYNFDNSTIEV